MNMEIIANDILTAEFFSIALDARHDPEKLQRGETQKTYTTICSIMQARSLSRATDEERKKRSETFFDGIEYRQHLIQGKHDRGEAYGLTSDPLDVSRDCGGFENFFPIYTRVISIPEKIVAAGAVWDITLNADEWNMSEKEEMYNVFNIGRLILEENASVVVRGNVLVFTCQELIKKYPSVNDYDIGILSSPAAINNGTVNVTHEKDGADGKDGNPGVPPRLGANFLGKVLPENFMMESLDGCDGADGENGADGVDGINGGACRIAELNIRSVISTEPIRIGVIADDGGNGSNGGRGGNGGNGGNGIDAIKTFESIAGPGKGGRGGRGGNGGNGGKPGHSGISSNVYVTVDPTDIIKIYCFSKSGQPGIPGNGGLPGRGGAGGMDGSGKDKGGNSIDGLTGMEGKKGRRRKPLPPASIYLNNEIWG